MIYKVRFVSLYLYLCAIKESNLKLHLGQFLKLFILWNRIFLWTLLVLVTTGGIVTREGPIQSSKKQMQLHAIISQRWQLMNNGAFRLHQEKSFTPFYSLCIRNGVLWLFISSFLFILQHLKSRQQKILWALKSEKILSRHSLLIKCR